MIGGDTQRYFDQRIGNDTTFVLPGFHFVQQSDDAPISTLLGSCVSACIRDLNTGVGGLNHFLLPEKADLSENNQSARYGVNAMEVLINDLLKLGGKKSDFEAKVFGGAQVIKTSSAETVGTQNGEFVKQFLSSEGIPVVAEDLGGASARRIYFYTNTGKVSVLRISTSATDEIRKSEMEMKRKVGQQKSESGGLELF